MLPWTLTHPISSQILASELSADNSLDGPFPLYTASIISKNKLKRGLVTPHHTFPLCASRSRMSSGPETSLEFPDVDYMTSACRS